MPVIMSDCLLCKNFIKIYKKHLSSPPKCFCLLTPDYMEDFDDDFEDEFDDEFFDDDDTEDEKAEAEA